MPLAQPSQPQTTGLACLWPEGHGYRFPGHSALGRQAVIHSIPSDPGEHASLFKTEGASQLSPVMGQSL